MEINTGDFKLSGWCLFIKVSSGGRGGKVVFGACTPRIFIFVLEPFLIWSLNQKNTLAKWSLKVKRRSPRTPNFSSWSPAVLHL